MIIKINTLNVGVACSGATKPAESMSVDHIH